MTAPRHGFVRSIAGRGRDKPSPAAGTPSAGCSGGKGANLAEMTRLGIPVPPGFTITTQACLHYLRR